MSDLQISLLAIGLLVVLGVMLFNWLQERKYRRQSQQAFQSGQDDVLLEPAVADVADAPPHEMRIERIEPVVSGEIIEEPEYEAEAVAAVQPLPPEMPRVEQEAAVKWPGDQINEAIDYVAQIHFGEPVAAPLARQALTEVALGKPVCWLGLSQHGEWGNLADAADETEFVTLAAGLQLADRSGPVNGEVLNAFCAMIQDVAGRLHGVAELPDKQGALQTALELDQFCVAVDVLYGLNVISANGEPFVGTKVRALAEAAGMRLMPDGVFHYINDQGARLFALSNHDSAPFSQDGFKTLATHGVTLLIDVPKVANGLRVFEQVLTLARHMADALKGQVVDDNRKPLSDAGIARIRQQLAEIYARMDARHIRSGSALALRLFA